MVDPFLSVEADRAAWTSSLKVAVTGLVIATPVAFAAGLWPVTVGAVVSGADTVVNVHDNGDIVLPKRSWAPLKVAV